MNNSNTIVKKGFLKRIFDYIKTKNYNKKAQYNLVKGDWEKIKWRYRIGKLSIFAFFFVVNYKLFVKNVIQNNNEIFALRTQSLRDSFENVLLTKHVNQYENFIENLKIINKNFFDFDIENNNTRQKLFIKDLFNLLTTYNTINNFDLEKNLKLVTIIPKTNMDELSEMADDIQTIFNSTFKKYLPGIIFADNLLLTTNTIDQFENKEQTAFIIALRLAEYNNNRNNLDNEQIPQEFSNFLSRVLQSNADKHNYKYLEDLNFVLEDLEKTKNPIQTVFLNPFFKVYFEKEYNEFNKAVSEIILNSGYNNIQAAFDIVKRCNLDVNKLTTFNFSKFTYLPLSEVNIYD